jgi:predicted nucleic acid-binding Zn ribbon protein
MANDKCKYRLHVHNGEWCQNILVDNTKKKKKEKIKFQNVVILSLHVVIKIQFLIP